MVLRATVTDDGTLKVLSPLLKPGEVVLFEIHRQIEEYPEKGNWSNIKPIVDEAAKLDIPRRTIEEILKPSISRDICTNESDFRFVVGS